MQGKTETKKRCGRRGNVATMRLVTGDWREVDRAKRASRRRLAGGGRRGIVYGWQREGGRRGMVHGGQQVTRMRENAGGII